MKKITWILLCVIFSPFILILMFVMSYAISKIENEEREIEGNDFTYF